MFSHRPTILIAAGVAAVAVAAGTYGIVNATSSSGAAATTSAATRPAGLQGGGGGGSNARSGPAAGGSTGTVSEISPSGFTLTTPLGQKVTVVTASAVTKGATVLVLGTVDSTTITADQVILQPPTGDPTTAATVVPFTRGGGGSAKSVGQIPADYQQGSGTIVGGATAEKATEAALTAYPGGIVDRVVKLSNGEYEVHNIGVSWPHHIFVSNTLKVLGAN